MMKRGMLLAGWLVVALTLWLSAPAAAFGQGAGPQISEVRVLTPGPIERYAPFEVAFDITNSVATNPYWPYETNTPAGVPAGVGISVDVSLLPPGSGDWSQALTLPCFYYQPVEALGTGVAGWARPGGAGGVALSVHAGSGRRVAIPDARDGCRRLSRERRGQSST